jgi:hypothetical protein
MLILTRDMLRQVSETHPNIMANFSNELEVSREVFLAAVEAGEIMINLNDWTIAMNRTEVISFLVAYEIHGSKIAPYAR